MNQAQGLPESISLRTPGWGSRSHGSSVSETQPRRLAHVVMLLGALMVIGCSLAAPAATVTSSSVAFSCHILACGMSPQGAYPHFVIGRVIAVADTKQAQSLFEEMHKHGHWQRLPDGSAGFWKNLQPIAIDAGHGTVIITLTSQDEMQAAPIEVGDYVRYSPHRGKYEVPPADKSAAMYWRVDGCVAVLCRASDKPCMKHYVSGLFRTSDGEQLSQRTLMPLARGTVIDVQTMLPRKVAQVK